MATEHNFIVTVDALCMTHTIRLLGSRWFDHNSTLAQSAIASN